MGTWDSGPFENDMAADWCADLEDAEPDERAELIREALTAVTDDDEDFLDAEFAEEAIAAAAVVASQLPGGDELEFDYMPDLDDDGLEIEPDFPALALRALDRIVGEDSEWLELREEEPGFLAESLAVLEPIRAVLARAKAKG